MDDEDYACAYNEYVLQACDDIAAYVCEPDVRMEVPTDLHPLLDGFAAKFKFVCLDPTNPFYGLPVLTQAPLRVLASHLARIEGTIKEVFARHPYVFSS